MLLTLSLSTCMFIAQAITTDPGNGDLILKIIIPTGGISGTLFTAWYYTFKYFMRQNQKQFEFALKQNQEQYDKSLNQVIQQHKDSLTLYHNTTERMFQLMQKDIEYKEVLTGVLTEMKETLINFIENHERNKNG